MLLHESLENSAALDGQKTALVFEGRRLTYAEIDRAANRLANALIERGLGRQDRVAIFLRNSVESVVSRTPSSKRAASS